VIQTGTIAAVAVGFARYLGVLFPSISPKHLDRSPINLGSKYALSLSVQQVGRHSDDLVHHFSEHAGCPSRQTDSEYFHQRKNIVPRGPDYSRHFVGRNAAAISDNFSHLWTVRDAQPLEPASVFCAGGCRR